ncbi:MAG: hypothetical protein H6680_05570 [Desulfobacteraceae bacterium]|nr:hypothetical protein [Desulfobacteraceae bacterium]
MENKMNFIAGICLFTSGCLIYALARQTSPFFISEIKLLFHLPEIVIFSSPAFFHTVSMILISSPFIERKKKSAVFICVFWTAIQIFFEIGQKYPDLFINFLPGDFYYLKQYFRNGTYDPLDIGMAVAGGLTGIIILCKSQFDFFIFKKGNNLCQKKTRA